jgi:hypothetical protein
MPTSGMGTPATARAPGVYLFDADIIVRHDRVGMQWWWLTRGTDRPLSARQRIKLLVSPVINTMSFSVTT